MPNSPFNSAQFKRTFGQFNEPNNAGYYTRNKTAKTIYCAANNCIPSVKVASQSDLLTLKKSNLLKYYNYTNSFNKANLNINLLTKLNLENVEVLQRINNVSGQPYLNFNIDPNGQLFGLTPCGANNFVSYMVYNPPPSSVPSDNIPVAVPS